MRKLHLNDLKLFYKWCKVLKQDITNFDLTKQSMAMAYMTLFSLVPSLAAIFTLISVFKPFFGKDSSMIMQAKSYLLEHLAAGSGEQVISYLDKFIANLDLTKIGLSSFAFLLVTLILLLRNIERVLNKIWLVHKERNIFKRFIYFWTFLTLGTFVIGLAIGVISGFSLNNLVPFGDTVKQARGVFSGLSTLGGIMLFFFLLYKVVPNTNVSFKEAGAGAIVGGFLFHQASGLYGYYAANFNSYQNIYGAIAALPLFLFWLYICWLIILFGAVVAWRVGQGFVVVDENVEDLYNEKKPENVARNMQIRSMVPLLLSLEIYRKFNKGEGKGITGHDLALNLKMPPAWIVDALEALEHLNLIIAADEEHSPNIDIEENALKREFFPTYPLASLTVAALLSKLTKPTQDWMNTWAHEIPIDYRETLIRIANLGDNKVLKMNLVDLIKQS